MQHNQVWMAVQRGEHGTFRREVRIGFVHHHHARETGGHLFQLFRGESIARGVVGRANPEQFRAAVRCAQQVLHRQFEIRRQLHLAQGHVVRVRRHLIHPVTRRDGHRIVQSRFAEDAERQVDGLVAARASHEN